MGPYYIMMARKTKTLTFKERIVDKLKNTYSLSYDLFLIKGGVVAV
jgi:hypothetical protein